MEPIWDTAKERQAIKRAHRIGQRRDVFVEKLIARNTIEETILHFVSNQTQSQNQNYESIIDPPPNNSTFTAQDSSVEIIPQQKVHSLLMSLSLLHPLVPQHSADRMPSV